MRRIDRRDFAKEAGLAFLSGVTVTISSACGGGGGGYSSGSPTSGSPTTTTPPAVTDKVGAISDNHGHTAVIEAAKVDAAGAISLDIAGTSGHSQMISLTADAMAQIKAGRAVDTVSSNVDGHVHVVTFNFTGGEPPTRY